MSFNTNSETENPFEINRDILTKTQDVLLQNQSNSTSEIPTSNFPHKEINEKILSEDSTGSEKNSREVKNHLTINLENRDINKCFSEKFCCKICTEILYSPNMTKCCGETACHECYNPYIKISTCPFCKIRNFKIMPNFKIQKMKEMIIKKFNIEEIKSQPNSFNVNGDKNSTGKNNFYNFTTSVPDMPYPVSNYNLMINNQFKFIHPRNNYYNILIGNSFGNIPSNFSRLYSNARFFVIKSFNLENIEISKYHNKWATTKNNSSKLNEAFESSHVILLFSANKSGCFQGFALMTNFISKHSDKTQNNIWNVGVAGNSIRFNLAASFDVEWISHSELNFHHVNNLYNPLNNNESVSKSRDTQELPKDLGIKICNMFNGTRSVNIDDVIEKIKKSRKKIRQGYEKRNSIFYKNYDNSYKNEKREKYLAEKRTRSKSNSSRSS